VFSRVAGDSIGNGRGPRPAETAGFFKLYSASEGEIALDRLPGSDGSRNSRVHAVFLKAIGTPGLNLNMLGATRSTSSLVQPTMSRCRPSTTG
jgi:hypothetical protein